MGEKTIAKEMKIDKLIIILIAITSVWVSSNLNWGKGKPQTIIKADGKGYYGYLPAVFIYNDLNFNFIEEYEKGKYFNKNLYYKYVREANGRRFNRYFAGTAIPMTPFFLIAHGISKIVGLPDDGYADLYHICINIAAIFYLVIALLFFGKVLDRFGISALNKALSYLVIYFGTNWFYWVNLEPAVSHVYSVAFVPIFIYYFLKFIDNRSYKHLVISALTIGLLVLIRPINVLCVIMLPMFFGSGKKFWSAINLVIASPKYLITAVVLPLLVISIQLVIYKIQVGQFFIYSYQDEGFVFWHPEIINFLFSYKKGLFVYTPVLVLGSGGFLFWYRYSKWSLLSGLFFLAVIIYVLSSWHMWWYGGGFGTRVMIDYYIVWLLPIAFLLNNVKGIIRKLVIGFFTLMVVFVQYQPCQYRYYIIHWDGPTAAEYWDVFLKPWF